ncbi:hypothetical protein [Streptomyces longispororuber]|nr:hypothetical protein [Streptomyces longispororuber]
MRFSRYLVDALGSGLPDEEAEAETDAQDDDASTAAESEEPTADEDLADYVSRITDSRKAFKGKPLKAGTQAARAQWSKHRERLAALPDKERVDYAKWCAAEGKDVRLTASHVEFRGFMWTNFPHMARAYADAMRGRQQPQQINSPERQAA